MSFESPEIVRQLLIFTFVAGIIAPLEADEKDFDNWKKMDVPEAPALTAEEEKETFRIAPGFEIELAAAEPQVVDPVAIRWDPSGRLWAVEMRGYMPNVEGEGEQEPVEHTENVNFLCPKTNAFDR